MLQINFWEKKFKSTNPKRPEGKSPWKCVHNILNPETRKKNILTREEKWLIFTCFGNVFKHYIEMNFCLVAGREYDRIF